MLQGAPSKHVCYSCVGDTFLSQHIKKNGKSKTCDYCAKNRPGISVEELADEIEQAFERHYQRTSTEPDDFEDMMLRDPEGSFDFERHGDPVVEVIAEAAEIDEAIAADVQKILEDRHGDFEMAKIGEECEFDAESCYETREPSDAEFRQGWSILEKSLREQSRFFNSLAENILDDLFKGLKEHETFKGTRLVITIGPKKKIHSLYRARVFQSETTLKVAMKRPDEELGPPPVDNATGGRMNARGISVFYGAISATTALAEIRPPVGSRVMIGRFEIVRPLKILDLEALRSVLVKGSVFDPTHFERLARAKFLGRLSERFTRPVMPNDEASEYLVTQAVADYLASHEQLDGIMYRSVQVTAERRNIVLFHHASRVKPMELPRGTELDASMHEYYDGGAEEEYTVYEKVPEAAPPDVPVVQDDDDGFLFGSRIRGRAHFAAKDSLELDLGSVEIRHIKGVKFTTRKHKVRRHRMKKSKLSDLF